MSMWLVAWWRDVLERAIRTFAQAAIALLVVGNGALGIADINWSDLGSLAGGAALVSVLTSIATHGFTGNGPSFTSVNKDTKSKNVGSEPNDEHRNAA